MAAKPKPKAVPAAQHQAMIDRAETAEQHVARLERSLDDAFRGAAADIERLTADAAAERAALVAEIERWERIDLVRVAAHAAGYLDPEDAVARLADDPSLTDRDSADRAVLAIAEQSPHLLHTGAPIPRLDHVLTPLPEGAVQ